MDRETLHKLIDAGIDAISCDNCTMDYIEMVSVYVVNTATSHNAQEIAGRVASKELTLMQGYDTLAESVFPLYELMGQPVTDAEREFVRKQLETLSAIGLN